MDGVPAAKSSKETVWFVSGRIRLPRMGRRLLISGWQGNGKPDVNEFMADTVDELNDLIDNGLRHPLTGTSWFIV